MCIRDSILDDLHGADHPSLLLLGFLAVHVRDSPILVIGTYREAEARLDAQLAATSPRSSNASRAAGRPTASYARSIRRRRETRSSSTRSCGC